MNSLEYATLKHKGQKRKDGKDYITHPIAVADIAVRLAVVEWKSYLKSYPTDEHIFIDMFGPETTMDHHEVFLFRLIDDIGKLHDTVEDTDATLDDIEFNLFGGSKYGKLVRDAVDALTKRPGENYFDALMRVKDNWLAKIVKRADLTHNLSDLNEGSLKDKYRLAKYILEHNY